MKIFVTGGAGYIGSVSVKLLLDEGHDVVVFDSLERGHREAVGERARLVEGDLREPEGVKAAMVEAKPDAVMHFAAYAYVGESMDDPMMYFRNNVHGGLNLVDAMLAAGVKKIIFSSTCATYGQPETVPITEDESQRPENPYGESKLMFEKILLWHQQQRGFEPVFLRYFNAAGASGTLGEDHTPECHLIPIVLQVALGQRDAISVFGDDYDTPDGTCVRDYIHIEDLGRAHLQALEPGITGPFNLGTENGCSVKEVIEAARKVTGHAIPSKVAPRRVGDPAYLIADATKAKKVLGWHPKYSGIEIIMQHAWDWHKAHPRGYGGERGAGSGERGAGSEERGARSEERGAG